MKSRFVFIQDSHWGLTKVANDAGKIALAGPAVAVVFFLLKLPMWDWAVALGFGALVCGGAMWFIYRDARRFIATDAEVEEELFRLAQAESPVTAKESST